MTGDGVRTRDLAYVAVFAAIMVVLGLFPPIAVGPIPITAQSMGVMLAGSIIGARRGALAMLVVVVMAAVGLPVLSGGRGGIGVLLGPTGGYIVGWVVGAFVVGLLTERLWSRYNIGWAVLANVVGGVLVVYAFGIGWYSILSGQPVLAALAQNAIFLPGDLVKVAIASAAAVAVRRAYPVIEAAPHRA
jgi:biotin transport system substrate-specific component